MKYPIAIHRKTTAAFMKSPYSQTPDKTNMSYFGHPEREREDTKTWESFLLFTRPIIEELITFSAPHPLKHSS